VTYTHLIFDLDHTLWDYNTNAKETIFELYDHYRLGNHELFSKEELYDTFMEINESLWVAYNNDKLAKGYIRENRFKLIFEALKLPLIHYPTGIDKEYLFACPKKTNKIPYAIDILEYLKPNYGLHILTNGFNDVQGVKLDRSGLAPYFNKVITSESVGAKKPDPRIYEHALEQIGVDKNDTIMIGDNANTDIKGAREFGMDQVFFNPSGKNNVAATYEIKSLEELKGIF